jgi:uncharacterized RDD family membrane protein YckC
LPLAGIGRRFGALLYEALLLAALVLVAGFALAPIVSPGAAPGSALVMPSAIGRAVSFLGLFALGGGFFGWTWSEGRRTLPMKTWRLALVTADGSALSRRNALVRYLAAWIGPVVAILAYPILAPHGYGALAWPVAALNWLAAFVDPQRQFLHDRIAGTRIVRT